MATVPKKGRSAKDVERRSAKRLDDGHSMAESKEDASENADQGISLDDDQTLIEEPVIKEPTPEPVYEEPVLTQLIVDSFHGDRAKGLYEGEGEATFVGGHYYQGQFSEGLMHGQGKYTWADGVTYEGEFTKNKVTGKGTYTWPDGSTYEGHVVDGLRHGVGIFQCANGKMSYSGEWHEGRRHGKGRMNYDAAGMSFYEGDWVTSIRHGWGTRQYPSGNIYQGMWFDNVRHGEGSMRWLDRDQMYTGQWENSVQHGHGQHIWFLHRIAGSQYPLRNMYDGEFVHGLRHGFGSFYYANGARYEGEWANNTKHGRGKFIFKNGRVYEGVFEKDHILEFPTFAMDGMNTPDMTQIRTRTPLPSEHMSVGSNDSRNTYGPSFQLEVDHLLEEFAESDREEEATQVIFVIMRYITNLRTVYNYYSKLGYEDSPDNTYVLSRLQMWRMLKDCKLHHQDITLIDMDRVLALDKSDISSLHNPYSKILFREFLNYLVTLAYHIYHEEHQGTSSVLAWCLSKVISDNILKHACSVQGYIYFETRRSVNAVVHLDQAYEIYKANCSPRKHFPYEPTLKMRQFLFMLKDLQLLNNDLTPKAVIDILASDDPKVCDSDGAINMELEMTFLEFFEALVGCAQVYVTEAVVKDPTTPRPSTTLTQVQSTVSMTSTSRVASQVALDEGGEDLMGGDGTPIPPSDAGSPIGGRHSEMSHKTADRSTKPQEAHVSHHGSGSADARQVSHQTHQESLHMMMGDAKKNASFMSEQSTTTEVDNALAQSVASLAGAQSDTGAVNQDEDEEEEELDEATRQFNFWTHQVHIFFVRKFFPAAQHMSSLRIILVEKYGDPTHPPPTPEPLPSEACEDEEEREGSQGDNEDGDAHDLTSVREEADAESAHADA